MALFLSVELPLARVTQPMTSYWCCLVRTPDTDPALIAVGERNKFVPERCAVGGAFTLVFVCIGVVFGLMSVYKGTV